MSIYKKTTLLLFLSAALAFPANAWVASQQPKIGPFKTFQSNSIITVISPEASGRVTVSRGGDFSGESVSAGKTFGRASECHAVSPASPLNLQGAAPINLNQPINCFSFQPFLKAPVAELKVATLAQNSSAHIVVLQNVALSPLLAPSALPMQEKAIVILYFMVSLAYVLIKGKKTVVSQAKQKQAFISLLSIYKLQMMRC